MARAPSEDRSGHGAGRAGAPLPGGPRPGRRARDLAKWAQLPLRDARAGLQAIAPRLRRLAGGLLDLPRPGRQPRLPPPLLLGPFEPLLLGWRARDMILGDAREVITTNGIIRAIVLVEGRAVGTWTFSSGTVRRNLWRDLRGPVIDALDGEAADIQNYLAPSPRRAPDPQ